MNRTVVSISLVALVALVALPAAAQQRQTRFEAWQPSPNSVEDAAVRVPTPLPAATVAPSRRDHRYEGLLIGGIAVGALGAWMGASFSSSDCLLQPGGGCGREDRLGTAVVGGLVGAVVGGGLGYVIGRWGGSKPRAAPADSIAT